MWIFKGVSAGETAAAKLHLAELLCAVCKTCYIGGHKIDRLFTGNVGGYARRMTTQVDSIMQLLTQEISESPSGAPWTLDELVGMTIAHGQTKHEEPTVFEHIAMVLAPRARTVDVGKIGSLVWAYGVCGHKALAVPLVEATGEQVGYFLDADEEIFARSLGSILWSCTALGLERGMQPFLQALFDMDPARVATFEIEVIADIVWSCAKLDVARREPRIRALFEAVASELADRECSNDSERIAMIHIMSGLNVIGVAVPDLGMLMAKCAPYRPKPSPLRGTSVSPLFQTRQSQDLNLGAQNSFKKVKMVSSKMAGQIRTKERRDLQKKERYMEWKQLQDSAQDAEDGGGGGGGGGIGNEGAAAAARPAGVAPRSDKTDALNQGSQSTDDQARELRDMTDRLRYLTLVEMMEIISCLRKIDNYTNWNNLVRMLQQMADEGATRLDLDNAAASSSDDEDEFAAHCQRGHGRGQGHVLFLEEGSDMLDLTLRKVMLEVADLLHPRARLTHDEIDLVSLYERRLRRLHSRLGSGITGLGPPVAGGGGGDADGGVVGSVRDGSRRKHFAGLIPSIPQLQRRAIAAQLLSTDTEEFSNLRVIDLKEVCSQLGITKSGSRAALIHRLENAQIRLLQKLTTNYEVEEHGTDYSVLMEEEEHYDEESLGGVNTRGGHLAGHGYAHGGGDGTSDSTVKQAQAPEPWHGDGDDGQFYIDEDDFDFDYDDDVVREGGSGSGSHVSRAATEAARQETGRDTMPWPERREW